MGYQPHKDAPFGDSCPHLQGLGATVQHVDYITSIEEGKPRGVAASLCLLHFYTAVLFTVNIYINLFLKHITFLLPIGFFSPSLILDSALIVNGLMMSDYLNEQKLLNKLH